MKLSTQLPVEHQALAALLRIANALETMADPLHSTSTQRNAVVRVRRENARLREKMKRRKEPNENRN